MRINKQIFASKIGGQFAPVLGGQFNRFLQLITALKIYFEKSSSQEDFFKKIDSSNLITYKRRGRVSGVIFNGAKFRLKNLWFGKEYLEKLDRAAERERSLFNTRNSRNITRRNR